MGRRAGIAGLAALGLMIAFGACAPGPAATAPDEPYEGSDAPWDAARLAGVGFRATGNEPGWLVEVYPDSLLVFTTNYGADTVRFPTFSAREEGAGTFVYEASADGHALTVTLTDTFCQDDMSGQPFDTSVAVVFDGEPLRGCGRHLD